MKANKLVLSVAALETWHKLAQATKAFQQLARWEPMERAHALGLGDPHSDSFELAIAFGGGGTKRALAVHRGNQGLRAFAYVVTGQADPGEEPGTVFTTDRIEVVFVPKNSLAKEELRLLERVRFHGSGDKGALWPKFRSLRPGYVPWSLSLDEAEGLCGAMQKVTEYIKLFPEAAGLFAGREPLEIPFYPADPSFAGPLRAEDLQWHKLTAPPPPPAPAFKLSEAESALVQALPQREDWTWELDSFFVARGIDAGDRPYFLKLGVVVDARSRIVLQENTAGPQVSLERLAGRTLVDGIKEVKTRPATVHVGRQRLADALAELAGQCGCAVKLAEHIPTVAALRKGLEETSLRGAW